MTKQLLALALLGAVEISIDGAPVRQIESNKGRALLAYLAVENNRLHSREVLATLLWPDQPTENALRNLRQALYNLRQALPGGDSRELPEAERAGGVYLKVSRQAVQFNHDCPYWLDVEAFDHLLAAVGRHDHRRLEGCTECAALQREAVALYRGDFLAGFSLPDSEEFERWLLAQRDRLRERALHTMENLAVFHERRREWAMALGYLRRQLEIEPWRESGHRHLMHVLALSGDRTAALQQYEICCEVLQQELGADPSAETVALYQAIMDDAVPAVGEDGDNPYKGLHAFGEADQGDYFGQETVVDRLAGMVVDQPVVVLIGRSGSGKSSLIYAGLLPQLRSAGATPGRENRQRDGAVWNIIDVRLGDRPLENLASVLANRLEPRSAPADLAQDLRMGRRTLAEIIGDIATQQRRGKTLLVIDQFEELFTQVEDEQRTNEVLSVLMPEQTGEAQTDHALTILLSLRAGFGRFILGHRPLVEAMQEGLLLLGPMRRPDLERTITEPARSRGVTLEPGLLDRIVEDVGDEPALLPLLQFALTLLWQRRFRGQLAHAAYTEIGGVSGSLAIYAEEVFRGLSAEEQVEGQRLFMHLVRPGESTDDTGQRLTRPALGELQWALAQKLVDKRLLVSDTDATGAETVELAHEALIRHWGRMRAWLDEDRVFRQWWHRLDVTCTSWQQRKHSDDLLLRGAGLVEAEEWMRLRRHDIPAHLAGFIAASTEAEERRQALYEAQRQRELQQVQALAVAERARAEQEIRSVKRLRLLAAGLVALTAGIALIAYLGWNERSEAVHQTERALTAEATAVAASSEASAARAAAEQERQAALVARDAAEAARQAADAAEEEAGIQARLAHGRELMARMAELQQNRPDLAALLALEAWRHLDAVSDRNQLFQDLALDPFISKILHGETAPIHDVAFVDGDAGAVAAMSEAAQRQWDVQTGQEAVEPTLAPDRLVIFPRLNGERGVTAEGNELVLWDVRSWNPVARLTGHEAPIDGANFSVDGEVLASHDEAGTLILWDALTGTEIKRFSGVLGDGVMAVGPGSKLLATYDAVAGRAGVLIYDLDDGNLVAGPVYGHESGIQDITYSPDGRLLATGGDDLTVRLWDGATGQPVGNPLRGHTARVLSTTFSPDGAELASGGIDGLIYLWDASSGKPLGPALNGHNNWVRALAWDDTGTQLVSADAGGEVVVWDVARQQTLTGHSDRVREVAVSPDGETLYTAGYEKVVKAWDPGTGELRATALSEHPRSLIVMAASPNGRTLATGDAGGTLVLWDAETLKPLYPLLANGEDVLVSAAYSPDSRYVALGDFGGSVYVWDVAEGRLVGSSPKAHDGWVLSLAFSPDGTRLASGSSDGAIKWWDVSNLDQMQEGPLAPAGEPSAGHANWVTSLLFTPDGKTLLSGSGDHTIRFWNVATHESTQPARTVHEGAVWELAFLPGNPAMLVSLGGDGTIVWQDLTTGALVRPPLRTGKESESMAIGKDGLSYFLGATDTTAQVWRLPATDWREQACGLANRNLTPEEWQEYLHNSDYQKTCEKLP